MSERAFYRVVSLWVALGCVALVTAAWATTASAPDGPVIPVSWVEQNWTLLLTQAFVGGTVYGVLQHRVGRIETDVAAKVDGALFATSVESIKSEARLAREMIQNQMTTINERLAEIHQDLKGGR